MSRVVRRFRLEIVLKTGLSLMVAMGLVLGCGGGGGGDDAPTTTTTTTIPEASSSWDEMVWDQGNWG